MTQVRPGVEAALVRFAREDPTPTPAPDLESFAALLYDALAPLATLDGQAEWHLAHYCGAIGVMFQSVADVARDTPDGPGWSAVLDLDRCPDAWLPWLAQFVGVDLLPGTSPADMRERIAGTGGFHRGTPEAIRVAAQATLTGTRTVYFRERYSGGADPPYTLQVVTLTTETPSPSATLAAILAQKPGGIVLDFHTVAGWDYTALKATAYTYATLKTKFYTYNDLRDNSPH